MKVTGKYTIVGTDIRTGEKKVIEQNNLILDGVLNYAASTTEPRKVWYSATRMTLGTSDEPVQPSDTGIKGVLIAQTNQYTTLEETEYNSGQLQGQYKLKRKFTFLASDTEIGTVKEVFVGNSSYDYTAVSRVVLDTPIEKHEFMQLDIIWNFTFHNPGVWEGVIVGGSKDGQTDINWKITVSDRQFLQGLTNGFKTISFLKIGDSSANVDPITNWDNLAGATLYKNQYFTFQIDPYIQGSFALSRRIFLETDMSNGLIAEFIVGRAYYSAGSEYTEPLFRATFDPPLEKDEDHRLYIDFSIGFARGATTTSGTAMAGMGMSVSGINWEPAGA